MKQIIIFSLLAMFVACHTPGGNMKSESCSFNSDTTAILRLLSLQTASWNRGDIDGFMQGYWHSDSLRFITRKGIKYGYDSVASGYKRHYNSPEKMGKLRFSNLEYTHLSCRPPLYNVTGSWNLQGTDTSGGNFSLLLRRTGVEWKIITDHTW